MKRIFGWLESIWIVLMFLWALPGIVLVTILWWVTQKQLDALGEWTKEL